MLIGDNNMKRKIAELIVIFGFSFLLINVIGYIFKVTELVTILNNPNDPGGQFVSNIPTILSVFITIIVEVVKYYLKK